MAIGVGTTGPIVPYSGHGGKTPFASVSIEQNASQVIKAGDILIFSSGKASVSNTDPTPTAVLGVALDEKTTTGSVTDADYISVALANRGALFVGSVVANSTTDQTGLTMGTHVGNTTIASGTFGVVADPVNGWAVIDLSETAELLYLIAPVREQLRGGTFRAASTVNPRVLFQFFDSAIIRGSFCVG